MIRENVRLYREGRWTLDDRMVRQTVLPTQPIPLMRAKPLFGGHDSAYIVGSVTDVRRARWGWVLGTLSTFPEEDEPAFDFTGLHCEADFDSGVHMAHTTYRTHRGTAFPVQVGYRLRAVTLGEKPCWRGMKIR